MNLLKIQSRATQANRNTAELSLTSVLRGERFHGRRETLVELVLAGDEGLADGLLPEAQHTRVAPHLVNEGLKHHPPFLQVALLLLCLHGLPGLSPYSRTHPPLALTSPRALASSHTHTHTHTPQGSRTAGQPKALDHTRPTQRKSLVNIATVAMFVLILLCVFRRCPEDLSVQEGLCRMKTKRDNKEQERDKEIGSMLFDQKSLFVLCLWLW